MNALATVTNDTLVKVTDQDKGLAWTGRIADLELFADMTVQQCREMRSLLGAGHSYQMGWYSVEVA